MAILFKMHARQSASKEFALYLIFLYSNIW